MAEEPDYRLALAGHGMARLLVAFAGRKAHIDLDPASPWVVVTFEPLWGAEATPENGERRFAVWRRTQEVYDMRGEEVMDDPIAEDVDVRAVR